MTMASNNQDRERRLAEALRANLRKRKERDRPDKTPETLDNSDQTPT